MWKLSTGLFLLTVGFVTAGDHAVIDKENLLEVEGFGNEEVKESNMLMKCYDEETKSAYKIDSVWYPVGKCEQRICSRQNNSKTPYIKISTCQPCTACDSINYKCYSFKAEKNYPKCCPKCFKKSVINRNSETKKQLFKFNI